jgi:hypothetical protein
MGMHMELKKTLDHVFVFQLLASIGLILMMVFNTLTNFSALGFTGLWYMVDLRIEGSLATWLESMCMMLCFLPIHSILFNRGNHKLGFFTKFFFALALVAILFFSADEMVGLHEQIGEKLSNISGVGDGTFMQGFSWVLFYVPVMIVGLTFLIIVVVDLLKVLPKAIRKKSLWMGGIIVFAVASILILEAGEAYTYNILKSDVGFLTVFEESAELVVICCFYHLMHLLYLGMVEPSV